MLPTIAALAAVDWNGMQNVPCSIIVPLFNKVELTQRCVAALIANTDPELYELVLIDNASSDATPEFCATLDPSVVVIRNHENLGFAKACNQGAAAASAEHLMFLNNDTEVHPGWLEPLLAQLEDPRVGAVGSKLLFPDGTIQHAGVVIVYNATYPAEFTPTHYLYQAPADTPAANRARPFQVVTAAAMLVRRSTFTALDGYDEGYWNGYEDVDLCLRIGERGEVVMYEPASVVTHIESASGPERFRKTNENEQRLYERWAGRVEFDLQYGLDGQLAADPHGLVVGELSESPVRLKSPDVGAWKRAPAIVRDREATLEQIQTRREHDLLVAARGGSDVCWLEGEEAEPLVTVRIATYNRGRLVVDRAITSALEQTYQNIEVLVVGDACDEATTRAVESVSDQRVRFVRLPTRGLYPGDSEHRWMVAGGHPMVTALGLAKGSWIAPCDDDDELTPDHVEVLLTAAKERRLEMVWSRANCEIPVGTWREIGAPELVCGRITHGSLIYSLGLRHMLPNVRSWRIGEPGDWNLWRRMFNAGARMGFVDQVTYTHYAEARFRRQAETPVGLS